MIEESIAESRRFRLDVGRVQVDDRSVDLILEELDAFDVVIVRSDAGCRRVPSVLSTAPHHRLLPADHLMYWERDTATLTAARSLPDGWRIEPPQDRRHVASVIRSSFDDYGSHYATNPLFDPADVLDGYCEWAESLAASTGVWTRLMYDDARRPVGVALVSSTDAPPDVRLAGMVPAAQGRGHYAALLDDVTRIAAAAGQSRIQISTQSINVRVMRAWIRLGFEPVRTVATSHLVRADLIPPPA